MDFWWLILLGLLSARTGGTALICGSSVSLICTFLFLLYAHRIAFE
jgi:hypothetical protein